MKITKLVFSPQTIIRLPQESSNQFYVPLTTDPNITAELCSRISPGFGDNPLSYYNSIYIHTYTQVFHDFVIISYGS
jgi:hypothetical protein